jgi:hypothetical protein
MAPRIFIQIASYRDLELVPTCFDAINKANNPNAISFGIAWQASSEEAHQADQLQLLGLGDRLRMATIPWNEAKGVGYARLVCQRLWVGEEFTLQIDAHCRFVQGWDSILIGLWEYLRHKSLKPLLTAYAPSYLPPDRLNWWKNGQGVEEPVMESACRLGTADDPTGQNIGFSRDESGFYSFPLAAPGFGDDARILRPFGGDNLLGSPEPALGFTTSGHFIFTEGLFCQEVPYDPAIYFIGEEVSLGVRAWTNGYDIYYPHQQILFHYYTDKGRVRHSENHQNYTELDHQSVERVLHLLGTNRPRYDLNPYGIGNVRSLEDYQYFSGISFGLAKFNELARRGIPSNPQVYSGSAEFQVLAFA